MRLFLSRQIGCLVVSVLVLIALPCQATIIFEEAAGGTGDNVLFHCPSGDVVCAAELTDDDTRIIGTLQNTTLQVQFDADVNIEPGASGQATIVPVTTGDAWMNLDINWLNFNSTNRVILHVTPLSDDTLLTLFATDQFAAEFSAGFTVSEPAGAFFTISTADNQLITSVRLEANALQEVRQVRLGDVFVEGPVPIPEPGTMTLLGAGLISLGLLTRRRRQ